MNILEQIVAIANDAHATDRLGDIKRLAREHLDAEFCGKTLDAGRFNCGDWGYGAAPFARDLK